MNIGKMPALLCIVIALMTGNACKKTTPASASGLQYFEVGIKEFSDWRDSSFIVATANDQLIGEINAQLKLPVPLRKIVAGALVEGSGGYNTNATHTFKWHFKEDDWHLTETTIELSDGRAYSDVDTNIGYWLNNVKRYSPWNSYIKKKVNR